MDNLLHYMLNDIIEKGITPAQRKIAAEKAKLSPEEIANTIRRIYILRLGPLGKKQFDKIKQNLNKDTIFEQIDEWETKGILSNTKAEILRNEVRQVYGLPTTKKEHKEPKKKVSKKTLKK